MPVSSLVEFLSDRQNRAGIRVLWLNALLDGQATVADVMRAVVGRPQVPMELMYRDPHDDLTVEWLVRVSYPPSTNRVRGLALVSADGDILALGSETNAWSTYETGTTADVLLTVQRGDVWL